MRRCSHTSICVSIACVLGALAAPMHVLEGQDVSTPSQEVLAVPVGTHGTQSVLYIAPTHARGAIVMLPGGAGNVGLEQSGALHNENFLIRTRLLWVEHGYAVIIPDALDHKDLRGLRASGEYAAAVDALVKFAHTRVTEGPVILMGTSQGSIAAMNGASHAQPGDLAGVVLTESVSRLSGSHETVFDADPAGVRVPALVVANRDDACNVAPPSDASRIASSMKNSPGVRVLYVSGGISRVPNACEALTPHGYYGIEQQVVAQIADWMQALH